MNNHSCTAKALSFSENIEKVPNYLETKVLFKFTVVKRVVSQPKDRQDKTAANREAGPECCVNIMEGWEIQ